MHVNPMKLLMLSQVQSTCFSQLVITLSNGTENLPDYPIMLWLNYDLTIHFYLKLLPENKNRRRAYKKFRSFRLRCVCPNPADDPISDSDDSPGEFADGITAGLIKLTSAFTACTQGMKKPLLRFALQQRRQNSKKRSFSQALKTGQVTLCID